MSDLLPFIQQQLTNQFFSGGLVLGILAGVAAALRKVPGRGWYWIKRRLITTVDIADHDQAFYWLQSWLGKQDYTLSKAKILTLSTRTTPITDDLPKMGPPDGSSRKKKRRVLTEMIFSPAPGTHLLRYHGHFILLTRIRTEKDKSQGAIGYNETFILQSLSRKVIERLIHEAREAAFPSEDSRIAIFRGSGYTWNLAQHKEPRDPASVVLGAGVFEDLTSDLTWFLGAKELYARRGIPYQRGYQLDGPPGNGKTTVVTTIAGILDMDVYILNMPTCTDDSLCCLMANLPEHSILLIEDIDRCFSGREKTGDSSDLLSFGGLINAIDGIFSPVGRVLFITTNHPELLDPALNRRGRADRRFTLTNATEEMARRLFLRFFPNRERLADQFAAAVEHHKAPLSMADLQEVLIKHIEDPVPAVKELMTNGSIRQDGDHLRV